MSHLNLHAKKMYSLHLSHFLYYLNFRAKNSQNQICRYYAFFDVKINSSLHLEIIVAMNIASLIML